jgi:thiol-disulfide isomerase/thioredoxin
MFYLSKKDFNEKNNQQLNWPLSNGISIVKFYAPWCGYCKKSQPDYEKLDKRASGDFNICMYDIESGDNKLFLQDINNSSLYGFKVEGYPTHVIFSNGNYLKVYNGERDYTSILDELLQVRTSLKMYS